MFKLIKCILFMIEVKYHHHHFFTKETICLIGTCQRCVILKNILLIQGVYKKKEQSMFKPHLEAVDDLK